MSAILHEALPCGEVEWYDDAWYWVLTCLICQRMFAVISFPLVNVVCDCGQRYQLGGVASRPLEREP